MTNSRYVENMIATAITERDKIDIKKKKLVFHEGKIQCWPRDKVGPDTLFICQITEQQLREGFSVPEWRSIAAKAMSIIKEFVT